MRSVRGGDGLPERAGGALLPFSRSGLPCRPHSDSTAAVALCAQPGTQVQGFQSPTERQLSSPARLSSSGFTAVQP